MKRLPLLTLAAVLALAAPAGAKELTKATVCGPSGCEDITDRSALVALTDGGPPTGAAKKRAPFYTLRFTYRAEGERHTFKVAWIPSQDLIRAPGEPAGNYNWSSVPPANAATLRRAARGLRPFPASKLRIPPGSPTGQARVVEVINPPPLPPDPDDGFPWLVVILATAGTGLVVGSGLVLTRRRRRRLPPGVAPIPEA